MDSSEPRCLYLNDRELFFTAYTTSTGSELYSILPQDFYRFSVLGIELVEDIHPGTDDGNPCHFTPYANMLFFSGTPDWNTGSEILGMWGSNYQGLLKDLNPTGSSYPSMFTPHLDSLFFVANDGSTGEELWEYVKHNVSSSSPPDVMLTSVSLDPSHGCDAGGRTIAQGLDNGDGNDGIAQNGLPVGEIDYSTLFCSTNIVELVADIDPGGGSSQPTQLTAVGTTLFFLADDGTHGTELWKSDGTSAGTMMLKDIYYGWDTSYTNDLTVIGSTLFLKPGMGFTDLSCGRVTEPPRYGHGQGHYEWGRICRQLSPRPHGCWKHSLFMAEDATHGIELWKSDGTASGTVMVKDINTGSDSGLNPSTTVRKLTAVGNTLYFEANDGTNGTELWKSDGTASGTVMVKDTVAGGGSFVFDSLTAVGNTLYFRASDGTNGIELWKSDGTASGTVMVKDINIAGARASIPGSVLLSEALFSSWPTAEPAEVNYGKAMVPPLER